MSCIKTLKEKFTLPEFTGQYKFSPDDPPQLTIYMLANGALLQLKGLQISELGRYTKYGFTVPELISYFQALLTGESPTTDTQGFAITGLLNGTHTSSPFTSPDAHIRLVSELTAAAHMKVRNTHNKQSIYLNKVTEDYITKKRIGHLHKIVSGDYSKIWEHLLVRDNPNDKNISQ